MTAAADIRHEIAHRIRGIAPGGIRVIHLMAQTIDHVLNIAYNRLAGGRRLQHRELRRNDEVYLDALSAESLERRPAPPVGSGRPTTAQRGGPWD